MLSTIRSTILSTNLPLGRVATGAVVALLSVSAVAPALAQQQTQQRESERATHALATSTGLHHEQLAVYDSLWRDRLEGEAQKELASAKATVAANQTKADASAAKTAIADLGAYEKLPDFAIRANIDKAQAASSALAAAGAVADRKAAAAAAAAAEAASLALAQANTPEGAKTTARALASSTYGWGDDQFQCLSNLWQKESGWNYQASNTGSGATGIPQSLPGSKMATFGDDWASNATTQIKWGLDYISRSYGTPCSAWGHSQAVNWY